MAKYTGDLGITILNGTTITATDIISVEYGYNNDKVENDGMGDSMETNLTTVGHFTFTVNGYDDSPGTPTASSLKGVAIALQAAATRQGAFDLRPFGTTAGKRKITGTAHLDSYTSNYTHADNCLITLVMTATGAVTDTTQ